MLRLYVMRPSVLLLSAVAAFAEPLGVSASPSSSSSEPFSRAEILSSERSGTDWESSGASSSRSPTNPFRPGTSGSLQMVGRFSASLGMRWTDLHGGETNAQHFDNDFKVVLNKEDFSSTHFLILNLQFERPFRQYMFWGVGGSIALGFDSVSGQVGTSEGVMGLEVMPFQFDAFGSFGVGVPVKNMYLSLAIQAGAMHSRLKVSTTLRDSTEEDTINKWIPVARLRASVLFQTRSGLGFGFYGSLDIVNKTPEVGVLISLGGRTNKPRRVTRTVRTARPLPVKLPAAVEALPLAKPGSPTVSQPVEVYNVTEEDERKDVDSSTPIDSNTPIRVPVL